MRAIPYLAAALLWVGVSSADASAQDFQKAYQLAPQGAVSVTSLSGDIRIVGYDGPSVVVTATKHGRDADRVKVVDRSSAGEVDVSVEYPRDCDCDATVDFEVRVPSATPYRFEKVVSMSGDVEVSGVTGRVSVKSMSGDVRVSDVAGTVEATAMSGNVLASISRLEGDGDMEFTSMSGDVEVRLPSAVDARVDMATLSGSISTDFPIQVAEKKHGPGQTASGQLGGGSRSIRIKSLSGDARLLRN